MSHAPPPPPRALCVDAYGTLVHLADPAGRLVARLAERGVAVSRATAAAAFALEVEHYTRHCLTGREPASLTTLRRDCAAVLGRALARFVDHRLSPEALLEVLLGSLVFVLTPGAREGLTALRRQGLKLAVVSNWDCSLPGVLADLGVAELFDRVTVSALVGCEKPDPRIWELTLAELGLPAAVAWHVGDSWTADCLGAAAAGLTPILLGDGPAEVARVTSLAELPGLVAESLTTWTT